MRKIIDTTGWPVMAAKCQSCPFATGRNGEGPGDPELATQVLIRTGLQCSQICHHPRLHGKPETHLCRGQRDVVLNVLHGFGLISEATDRAFEEQSREVLGK